MAKQRRNQVLATQRKAQGADTLPTWRPDSRTVQQAVRARGRVEKLPPGSAELAAHAEAEAAAAAAQQATNGGGGDEDLAGFTELVGNQGGLTALLLAVREGHAETVQRAARRRRRRSIRSTPADKTSPLLHGDASTATTISRKLLIERGADPNIAERSTARRRSTP